MLKWYLGGVIAAFLLALVYGKTQYRAGYRAATLKIEREHQALMLKQHAQTHAASVAFQREKAVLEQKQRELKDEIKKLQNRPDYGRVCFDDDGLHLLREAIK